MISESLKKVVQPRSAECLVMNDGPYVAARPYCRRRGASKGFSGGPGSKQKRHSERSQNILLKTALAFGQSITSRAGAPSRAYCPSSRPPVLYASSGSKKPDATAERLLSSPCPERVEAAQSRCQALQSEDLECFEGPKP